MPTASNCSNDQLAQATARQEHLAAIRATYETQAAENRHRTQLVDRAEQNLSEARASHAGANAASLIGSIDLPDTGSQPVGPSRTIIALGGLVGGLITGLGVFFLALPQKTREEEPTQGILSIAAIYASRGISFGRQRFPPQRPRTDEFQASGAEALSQRQIVINAKRAEGLMNC